ncbi:MAG: hypothetical protein QRY71_04150 [Candidatus Rhabdochlamydia sp.]
MLSHGLGKIINVRAYAHPFSLIKKIIGFTFLGVCLVNAVAIARFIWINRQAEYSAKLLKNAIKAPYQDQKTYAKLLEIFQGSILHVTDSGKAEISHPLYTGTCSLYELMDRVDLLALENIHFSPKERWLGLQLINQVNQWEKKASQIKLRFSLLSMTTGERHPGQEEKEVYTHPSFSHIVTLKQYDDYFSKTMLGEKGSFRFEVPCPISLDQIVYASRSSLENVDVSLQEKDSSLDRGCLLLQGEWILSSALKDEALILKWKDQKGVPQFKSFPLKTATKTA